ncbi:MAG: anhydro-N-acetylmuramic acid kinase [Bryobacterales bacterium]|nr:anhydro-N-acetylmuramic acid kinase [Bryobacterales bacterium]
MIVAGIMSGTSLDGIDVAVVDCRASSYKMLGFHTEPYPRNVRQAILAVSNRVCHVAEVSRLNFLLPQLYAKAFQRTPGHRAAELIGCHGQTIYHEGGGKLPNTLQIGDGSVLAELTGVPVVSNFRPRDIAAGGQGAPLIPFVDYHLFRHARRGRVALNIGGIANITVIPPKAEPDKVIAFDTGPGNMVVDQLVAHATGGRETFDRDGRRAAKGTPDAGLLWSLLRHPYYRRRPPKSAGREQYGQEFVNRLLATGISTDDLIATATAFTALTIADQVRRFAESLTRADDLIVSGGGARNPQILGHLAAYLPHSRVTVSSEFGLDPDAKEAVGFAILAYQTWRRNPSNLPSATGARHAVVLGNLSL